MAFGQVAADYVPQDFNDDIWIRNFKEPYTQLRIIPVESVTESGTKVYGAEAWLTEREHFKDSMSFPCAERQGLYCPGCNDSSARVRERSRRYYVPVFDDQGEQRIWRFPASLQKTLLARQQRALSQDPENKHPLSDRDYTINKMGKAKDTTYDPEPGDKYAVEWPDEVIDIVPILTKLYEDAIEKFGAGDGDGEGDYIDDLPPEPKAPGRIKPKADEDEKPAPRKRTASADAAPSEIKDAKAKQEIEDTPDEITLTNESTQEDFDEADTQTIRDFLKKTKREFPARAGRKRLIEIALEPPF